MASELALTMSKDGNPELYTVGASGGGARRLTRYTRVSSQDRHGRRMETRSSIRRDERGSPQLYRISSRAAEQGN